MTGSTDAGASFDGVYTASGTDALVVPHGGLILGGAYHRAGPDLVIEGASGEKVLVVDYFRAETPPDLVTEGGARIAGDLAERLAGSQAPGQVAQAGTAQAAAPIGEVESLTGAVTATRNGSQVQLSDGSPVYQGDIIETGENAAVGIRFIDETVFAMDDAGRMVLDELIYDPGTQSGSVAFSLVQGVFSFATGQIAKTDPSSLIVRTPVAMIGVRGTDVAVDLNQIGENSRIACREGAIVVRNDGGEQLVLAGQQVLLATFQQAPTEPEPVSLGTLDFDFGRALQFRPQQNLDQLNQDRRGDNDEDDERRSADGGETVDTEAAAEQLGDVAPAAGGQQSQTAGAISLVAEAIETGVDLGTQPNVDTDGGPLGSGGGSDGGGDRSTGIFFTEERDEAIRGGDGGDTLVGTTGPDEMFGGAGNDVLLSSAGNDSLFGGDGIDTADYSADTSGIVADLGAGTVSGEATGNDSLEGIENLVGTGFGDQVEGAEVDNTLLGGGGDDTLGAAGGNDVVDGGTGNDSLIGGNGEGDDVYIGGEGRDQISYPSATAGIVINLATGIVDGVAGGVGTDTLSEIEDVLASNFDDLIIGDGVANLLMGAAGNDTLIGNGGDDTLDGGADTDLVSYADASAAVNVDLGAGLATGPDGNDQLIDIENAQGSGFGDVLTGNGGGNLLIGGGGVDTISGGGGDDTIQAGAEDAVDDVMDGGAGTDRLQSSGNLRLAGFSAANAIEVIQGAGAIRGTSAANLFDFSAITLLGITMVNALEGDDTVSGSAAADLIVGGEGDDVLTGNAGNDTLTGGAGDDSLDGGDGNDLLSGAPGTDTLIGGAGNDTLLVGATDAVDDVLDGGAGTDRLQTAGDLQLDNFGPGNSIEQVAVGGQVQGTGDANLLDFSASTLTGATGIFGQGGDDTLIGSAGADNMSGGDGDDLLVGNAGNDTLTGNAGNDVLSGGAGNDLLTGGAGVDNVIGGAGNDTLVAGATDAVDDTLAGGAGTDRLQATGNLQLSGFGPGNSIEQVAINGQLQGTGGANLLDFSATTLTGVSAINAQGGNDTVIGSAGSDNIIGGDGNDSLTGNAGNDTLTGNAGNDVLSGGAGNDLLTGGAGVDNVIGGAGNDTLVAGATDAVDDTLAGGAGTDRLQATGNLQLSGFGPGNSIEQVAINGQLQGTAGANLLDFSATTLSGVSGINAQGGNDTVIGSAGGDNIIGGDGNDSLTGNAGNDTLSGGAGNDVLAGGAGVDNVQGGAGNDTLIAGATDAVDDDLDGGDGTDVLQATGDLQLSGFGPANSIEQISIGGQLQGTGGANTFDLSATSLAGVTAINLQGGNDTLIGTIAGDVALGGAGNDSLSGRAGDDNLSGGAGNDLLDGGADDDTLAGDEGADTLLGQAGDDSLSGGAGNDQLTGGTGVDTLVGGAGNDTLFVSADEDAVDTFLGGTGTDRLVAGNGLQLADFTAVNSIEVIEANGQISGTGGGDVIDVSATTLVNVTDIDGGGGDDALTGNGAADSIAGGDGADTLIGGAGDDVLFGDNATATPIVASDTAGTLGTLTAGNFANFWGDVLLLTGATTTGNGLTDFSQGVVSIDPAGVGVEGVVGQPVTRQIAFDVVNNASEVLQIGFEREVFDVTVTVSHLLGPENDVFEQGQWVAMNNGVEVGSGLFSDAAGTNNGQISFDLDVDGPIDTLLFTATPYVDADGVFQFPVDNDSSDYFVRQIAFSYDDLSYADSGTGSDLLIGGAGADLMRGGAAADLFHYDSLGDGTAIASDITVSQSGLATDVILDFVSGEDGLSFDASAFDASATFVTVAGRYDGTNSGEASGAVFVFDGKYLSYDDDVEQEGYTAIAEVRGDAPVAGDIAVS
ncbi:MAG: FecR domain-containing protein [Alphaproteobacteria bacterium]